MLAKLGRPAEDFSVATADPTDPDLDFHLVAVRVTGVTPQEHLGAVIEVGTESDPESVIRQRRIAGRDVTVATIPSSESPPTYLYPYRDILFVVVDEPDPEVVGELFRTLPE